MICTTTGSVIRPYPLLKNASVILLLNYCLDYTGKYAITCRKGSRVIRSLISYVLVSISVRNTLKEANIDGFKFLILSKRSLNFYKIKE